MPKTTIDADQAAAISFKALAFLAEDRGRLARFLDLTGVEPRTLRSQAVEPPFQAAILEHVMGDENLLLEFCSSAELEPAMPAEALRVLTLQTGLVTFTSARRSSSESRT
jgi:hypothetical protein